MRARILLSAALFLHALPALAAPPAIGESGLPIPRFASLKSDEANMRSGPGTRYPIRYVYQVDGLPVEIIAEYQYWREIRDPDGETGWMHKSILSGERTALTTGTAEMRRQPSGDAAVQARLAPKVLVTLEECGPSWCRAEVQHARGWLHKQALWGVYPDEIWD